MGNQKETVSRKGKSVKSKNAAPKGKNPEKRIKDMTLLASHCPFQLYFISA
ncbi:hypothetical protein PIB30_007385 [Stylosanthes scabra]|uniref:Uncharacterized protein n=1 Tax=Stylosanthes scabra TaxID=79078 RepID=A0ABU6Z1A9_9FABA|nr:hypothetical protein [Stylosanthes scabra]